MTAVAPRPPRRVLVVLAHPLYEQSRTTRRLAEAAATVDGVTVDDLYERYPTFEVDARAEQALLAAHDVIVFQHPLFWYSVPALLKQWQDVVLEHGWAYGGGAAALRHKLTFHVITTGGAASAYQRTGHHRYTMRELLLPWEQAAHLCGLRWLAPFVVHAAQACDDAALTGYEAGFRRLLEAVRDRRLDLHAARAAANLADELDGLVRTAPEVEPEGAP